MFADKKSKTKAIMRSVASLAFAASLFAGGSAAQDNAVEADLPADSSYHEDSNSDGIGEVENGDSDKNNDTTRDVHTNEDAELDANTNGNTDPDAIADKEAEVDAQNEAAVVSALGDAGGFNVFVRGNYTNYHGNVDIGYGANKGNIAVGGDVTLAGNCSAGLAVVGGTLTGSFDNGYFDSSYGVVDFDETFRVLEETSRKLAELTPNGVVCAGGWSAEIVFTGMDTELNVFTITVDEFNAMRGGNQQLCFNFDVPEGSKYLVNIVGSGSVNLNNNAQSKYAGMDITNGSITNEYVIFNLPDAQNVEIGRNMGALIAVNADVTNGSNGAGDHFEGTLICNSYVGYNEFGSTPIDEDFINEILNPDPDESDSDDNEDDDDEDDDDEDDGDEDDGDEDDGDEDDGDGDNGDGDPNAPVNPDQPSNPNTPDVPSNPNTPDVPSNPDKPDVPSTPDTSDTEDDTPDVPDSDETPDSDEDDTPDVPSEPDYPTAPTMPTVELPVIPDVEEYTSDTPVTPDDDISVVEFDDPTVPLADTPFDDDDDTPDSDTDSSTANPKTGQDTTAYGVTAAAAMASFLALLYASKARREAEKNK